MSARRLLRAAMLTSLVAASACSSTTGSSDATTGELAMGTRPWNAAAETEWSSWIAGIGEARAAGRCTSVNACLDDATINPFKRASDARLDVFADCADLPMELRAYFAMKTNRPFRYVSEVVGDLPAGHDPGAPPDYRYTANNHPTAWSTAKTAPSLQSLLTRVSNVVHSGFFRTAPDVEDTDTYPVDVRPGTVHPGTLFYDPNGHVLVVYRVDANGSVYMMDGHPDNSLTHTIFSDKLALGGRSQGGGFRNFRPIDSAATALTYTPNAQLTDFGDSQYGHGHGYYDWVRAQLSGGRVLGPDAQFGQLLDQLCVDLGDRVAAVDAGVHLATGPIGDVPPNVYSADGDWEAFSSPGRDGRLRASFRGLFAHVTTTVAAVTNGDAQIAWSGTAKSLVSAYQDAWRAHQASCEVTYTSSTGSAVRLGLADVQARIFDLSFDPYHCAEMRWGATSRQAQELATCSARDPAHVQRFDDERRLRNAIDRPPPGSPTPFDWGPDVPEDVDVPALLERLGSP